ncbi:hypothetical protein, partial [Kitasatospora sp. NPDC002040]|uniref:hypothetical protein n=1 Tax=Kitasatospora sp. NPDC002040 TaxID=3154661 RepID=UPI0033285F83
MEEAEAEMDAEGDGETDSDGDGDGEGEGDGEADGDADGEAEGDPLGFGGVVPRFRFSVPNEIPVTPPSAWDRPPVPADSRSGRLPGGRSSGPVRP